MIPETQFLYTINLYKIVTVFYLPIKELWAYLRASIITLSTA